MTIEQANEYFSSPVSYTQLTLPTNYSGEITVGAVTVKKKKKKTKDGRTEQSKN